MIRIIKSKDLNNFTFYCKNKDQHSDFYITRNNERVFLDNRSVSKNVFNDCLKRSDKCLIKEDKGSISGILLVTGFVDKFDRKYVKILADNDKIISDLLKVLTWEHNTDLYIKVKKENPICKICQRYGFKFAGIRNKEILYYRKYEEKFDYRKKPIYHKEGDI